MEEDKPGEACPLAGFTPCKKKECRWYIHITGTLTNTGKHVDYWGCAIAWLPHLLIENANQARQTGAAVESLRNQTAHQAEVLAHALLPGAQRPAPPPLVFIPQPQEPN